MEVFKIPHHIPKAPTSTNKSVRFPNEVIDQVEEAIRGTTCSFSKFVIMATRFALENMEKEDKSPENTDSRDKSK